MWFGPNIKYLSEPFFVTFCCREDISCFFYMDIVVCHKKYWEMAQNFWFYNSCFQFGCSNRVDENMIYRCCSFLSNVCRFVYDYIMLWPKMILTKLWTFSYCLKSSRFILKSPAIITTFFKMSSADSILFERFSNSFPSPFGGQ